MFASTITPEGLAVFVNGVVHNVAKTHPTYEQLLVALREQNHAEVDRLLDLGKVIRTELNDPEFSVEGALIYYQGKPFHDMISDKALSMIKNGAPIKPLLNFLRKLRMNPYEASQGGLLRFAETNGLLIHEDGDLIAFKGIREDWTDNYSGTISNAIGAVIPRKAHWDVDRDPNVHCSYGYHVGSESFARSFGPRTVIVKVHPADWVETPNDLTAGKGRVCFYQVVAEMDRQKPLPVQETYTDQDLGIEDDEEEEEEFDDDLEVCPNCGCNLEAMIDPKFCPECGDSLR